ncbi:hypothetical protein H0H93_007341 [Arthromyces matolae]|nr:hypothetical protein H0H93_007341 [Arthromyces matolae]
MKSTLISSVFAACVLATLLGAVSASPIPHPNVNTNNVSVPRDGPPKDSRGTGADFRRGNSVTHTGADTTTIRFGDLEFECARRPETPMYFGWSPTNHVGSSETSSGQSHVPTHPPCDETGHRSADNASHGQPGGGVITSATEGSPGKSTLVQSQPRSRVAARTNEPVGDVTTVGKDPSVRRIQSASGSNVATSGGHSHVFQENPRRTVYLQGGNIL